MGQKAFYFDAETCIGCKTCQVACKDRNRLELGQLYRIVHSYEFGEYPNAVIWHYSATCNHCETPACVANCPTGAMHKDESDGTVQHDDELCIGCEACVKSCPYGIPQLLEGKSITGKCDACKPFVDAGKNPVCVDACVMRCLDFGDVEELEAKYGSGLTRDLPVLPPSSDTGPSTLIGAKAGSAEASNREVAI